ncbi:MAG: bifunctional ADP-heptose synthase [Bacteroidales bacterium]|nr:bifunctional ADP-heptose synthase [Bacteroidales bacterium]
MDLRLTKTAIEDLFYTFNNKQVLIIGDVMVDAYLWGEVERISPEAPVPVVAVTHRANRLGGAANVALNIKAMGAEPLLCSVCGKDAKSTEFIQLLDEESMFTDGVIRSPERVTTTKFRIIGNNMQMLRVDEEATHPLTKVETATLFSTIKYIIDQNNISVILFQDYDKGVITKELICKVTDYANKNHIPIAVDPKKRNFSDYKNISLFKPNLKELKEGLKLETDLHDPVHLQEAVNMLHEGQRIAHVMVTLSEKGVFISGDGHGEHIPAHRRAISDVSGAGDTVISVMALCMAANISPVDAAAIANLAGGLVCEEAGVVPVNKQKLLQEVIEAYGH